MVAMARPRILVLVPMLAALAVGVSAVPAGATSWSTAPRVKAAGGLPPELVAVRVGRHDGFDRVVLQLRGSPPGYDVRYVPRVVQDGSGRPVSRRPAGTELPFTGLPLLALLGAGVGVVGVGIALLARERRRRGLPAA
jgi:hypothetical protein